tara:strand:+ start:326 stop:2215 length:1890 start_codon:yes stop_codon:yes gene_type:complete
MKKLLLLALLIVFSCSKDEPPRYLLTVSPSVGGSVSSTGGDYAEGKSVTITATANAEYQFVNWSNGSTQNPITVTVMADQVLTANFVKVKYGLTLSTQGEGTVSEELISSGRADYNSGSVVRLTATPAVGYSFTGWTGDVTSTDNPVEVDITSAKAITAVFNQIVVSLQVDIEGEGEVLEEVVSSGRSTNYIYGDTVKLTPQPAEGFDFISWSGDIGELDPTQNPLELTLTESKTIQALFEKPTVQYTLSVSASEGGTISTEGGIYDEGTEVTITATPNEGYQFIGWDNGTAPDSINLASESLTFQLISNQDYQALFEKIWWGQIVDFPPEIFFASDLSNNIREKFTIDLNLAISQFGNYGPLECYVLGNSTNAANELAIQYCNRRVERGQHGNLNACVDNQMNGNGYGMEYYRKDSDGNGIWASLNGDRGNDYHLLLFSKPYHYEEFPSSIEYTIIVFHEYFHVVNAAKVFRDERINIEGIGQQFPERGPSAMIEGSANYLSHYHTRKLFDYPNSLNSRLRPYMVSQMDNIKRARNEFPNCNNVNLSEINYGDSCDMYSLGTWGIAYLLDRADNINAYQEVLFPLINDIGYFAAFEQTFGITFDEFETEFKTFLELPISQQLEIIPDI